MTLEDLIVERARQAHEALTLIPKGETRCLRLTTFHDVVAGPKDVSLLGTMGVYTNTAKETDLIQDALAAWAELKKLRVKA